MASWWHEERWRGVQAALARLAPSHLADLGCGTGEGLARFAALGIPVLTGLEPDAARLAEARRRVPGARLFAGSVLAPPPDLSPRECPVDVSVMVEVIEHILPSDLPVLEAWLFTRLRPRAVVLTTPNAEFNRLLGVPPNRFRHPGHRFEWTRAQCATWAEAAAARHGYGVTLHPLAGAHPDLGGVSQMAVFRRD